MTTFLGIRELFIASSPDAAFCSLSLCFHIRVTVGAECLYQLNPFGQDVEVVSMSGRQQGGNCTKLHWQGGQLHRIDGPALVDPDGGSEWYYFGELHRADGPAVIRGDGSNRWYRYGKLHRQDGPAVEDSDGRREWYIDGFLHREDGPAIEFENGSTEWYFKGELHRTDGPAIEWSNGGLEWFLYGENLTLEEWAERVAKNGYEKISLVHFFTKIINKFVH